MECNASDCEKAGAAVVGEDPRVMAAAENLAGLLIGTAEYEAFARTSRAVQYDVEVASLVNQLNDYSTFGAEDPAVSEQVIKGRLEALPVVQEYRKAEAAVRALLSAVDAAISAAAGVDFAANAVAPGCG